MNAPAPRKTDWLSPQNLLAAMGMAGMVLTAYLNFQQDTSRRMIGIEYRVTTGEHDISKNSDDIKLNAKAIEDLNIRIDRLERERCPRGSRC